MCTLSCFYLIVSADQTHFFYEVDTAGDADIDENVDNELEVEQLNARHSFLANVKTLPKNQLDHGSGHT